MHTELNQPNLHTRQPGQLSANGQTGAQTTGVAAPLTSLKQGRREEAPVMHGQAPSAGAGQRQLHGWRACVRHRGS
jgi:hypothetical protein